MLFCKDCKHAQGDLSAPLELKCGHPNNRVEHQDLVKYAVSGIEQPVGHFPLAQNCIVMRTYEIHEMKKVVLCGPQGLWWEPRP